MHDIVRIYEGADLDEVTSELQERVIAGPPPFAEAGKYSFATTADEVNAWLRRSVDALDSACSADGVEWLAASEGPPVLYVEMNEIDINADRWFVWAQPWMPLGVELDEPFAELPEDWEPAHDVGTTRLLDLQGWGRMQHAFLEWGRKPDLVPEQDRWAAYQLVVCEFLRLVRAALDLGLPHPLTVLVTSHGMDVVFVSQPSGGD